MKAKIFLAAIFSLIMLSGRVQATDILVSRQNTENVNVYVYVMDDTVIAADTHDAFNVTVKYVKDGKLNRVVIWKFSKWRDDMWRYETSEMDGLHTTVVIPKNAIFEFCMDKLNWHYRIVDNYYY